MAGTLKPGSEGHSSPKGEGRIGSGLGSESSWHSPNSSSSHAGAASRPLQALWAQGRTWSPTPAGCPYSLALLNPTLPPSPSCKLPWVKPPEPALFLSRQYGITPSFSLPTHHIHLLPLQPSAPYASGRHSPHQCSSPGHSWMCQCPFALLATCRAPCLLPFLILVPPPPDKSLTMSAAYWGALLEDKGLFCSLLALGARPEDLGPSRYL